MKIVERDGEHSAVALDDDFYVCGVSTSDETAFCDWSQGGCVSSADQG